MAIVTAFTLYSQVAFSKGMSVNGTGAAAAASAMLDVASTNKGILFPRMTASQISAIGSPVTGLLVFQTDGVAGFYYYNGSAWVTIPTILNVVDGGDGSIPISATAQFVHTTHSGAAFTLPTAVAGKQIQIVTSGTACTVIGATTSNPIIAAGGGTGVTTAVSFRAITLVSDGTNWWVINLVP